MRETTMPFTHHRLPTFLAAILSLSCTHALLADPPARQSRRTPIVSVFESAKDAVVNIASTQIIEVRSPWDSMFEDFFNIPGAPSPGPRRQVRQTSVGSGFVIHHAGYIITNAHVVSRTAERKVVFADKREFPAQIIAIDNERDLAVLKIDAPEPLKPLRLGRSDDLMVGETVVAIGNPLGFGHTCTSGILSAIDRSIAVNEQLSFNNLIQIDAPINPGNSGGPLLNILGELIGINTAIRGDAQNIGFAIPVNQLRAVLPEMLDVERRYRIITGIHLDPAGSATVQTIDPDSPAQKAGLQPGDAIASAANQATTSSIDFHIALLGAQPGRPIPLKVLRQGKTIDLTFTPAQRPKPDGNKILQDRLGLSAQPLTDKLARSLGMKGLAALIVNNVEPAGPASKIGIKRGDVIIQFGRYPATTLDDVGQLLEKLQPGQVLQITVLRAQGPIIIRSSALIKAR